MIGPSMYTLAETCFITKIDTASEYEHVLERERKITPSSTNLQWVRKQMDLEAENVRVRMFASEWWHLAMEIAHKNTIRMWPMLKMTKNARKVA